MPGVHRARWVIARFNRVRDTRDGISGLAGKAAAHPLDWLAASDPGKTRWVGTRRASGTGIGRGPAGKLQFGAWHPEFVVHDRIGLDEPALRNE